MKKLSRITILFFPLIISSYSYAQSSDTEISQKTPLHSWAGYHIGIDLGNQLNSKNQSLIVNDPLMSLSGQGANTDQSILLGNSVKSATNLLTGGLHVDYLLQQKSVVYGIAADLMTANCKMGSVSGSTLNDPSQAFPNYFSTIQGKTCLNYFATVKGKIGASIGNSLFYIDGGIASGRAKSKTSAIITNIGNSAPPDVWTGSVSKSLLGYVIGAGMQYAFDKNISLGINMQHYDLGKSSYTAQPDTFTAGDQPGVYQSMSAHVKGNLLKISIDYQF